VLGDVSAGVADEVGVAAGTTVGISGDAAFERQLASNKIKPIRRIQHRVNFLIIIIASFLNDLLILQSFYN
jgi:hypothetical protein